MIQNNIKRAAGAGVLTLCALSAFFCKKLEAHADSAVVIQHQHSGSSEDGSGCYKKLVTEEGECGSFNLDRWFYDGSYTYCCRDCGAISQYPYDVSGFRCTSKCVRKYYVLSCGKTDAKAVTLSCGKSTDGWTRELDLNASYTIHDDDVQVTGYLWNGQAGGSSYHVTSNGTYTLQLAGSGNADFSRSVSVTVDRIDRTAPVIESFGASPDQWSSSVKLSVTASDGESGLAAQAYSFDGGTSWSSKNTYTVTANGNYSVSVRDAAGNIRTAQTTVSRIDSTPPHISVSMSPSPDQWSSSVKLSVTASDGESGLAAQAYSFDGGTSWSSKNTYTVTANGNYSVSVRDAAGNIRTTQTTVSRIDSTPPHISVSMSPSPDQWYDGELTVVVHASDAESGLADAPYSFDGGATYLVGNSYKFSGSTVLEIAVVDRAGNVSRYSANVEKKVRPRPTPTPDDDIESGGAETGTGAGGNSGSSGGTQTGTGGTGGAGSTGSGGEAGGAAGNGGTQTGIGGTGGAGSTGSGGEAGGDAGSGGTQTGTGGAGSGGTQTGTGGAGSTGSGGGAGGAGGNSGSSGGTQTGTGSAGGAGSGGSGGEAGGAAGNGGTQTGIGGTGGAGSGGARTDAESAGASESSEAETGSGSTGRGGAATPGGSGQNGGADTGRGEYAESRAQADSGDEETASPGAGKTNPWKRDSDRSWREIMPVQEEDGQNLQGQTEGMISEEEAAVQNELFAVQNELEAATLERGKTPVPGRAPIGTGWITKIGLFAVCGVIILAALSAGWVWLFGVRVYTRDAKGRYRIAGITHVMIKKNDRQKVVPLTKQIIRNSVTNDLCLRFAGPVLSRYEGESLLLVYKTMRREFTAQREVQIRMHA